MHKACIIPKPLPINNFYAFYALAERVYVFWAGGSKGVGACGLGVGVCGWVGNCIKCIKCIKTHSKPLSIND